MIFFNGQLSIVWDCTMFQHVYILFRKSWKYLSKLQDMDGPISIYCPWLCITSILFVQKPEYECIWWKWHSNRINHSNTCNFFWLSINCQYKKSTMSVVRFHWLIIGAISVSWQQCLFFAFWAVLKGTHMWCNRLGSHDNCNCTRHLLIATSIISRVNMLNVGSRAISPLLC